MTTLIKSHNDPTTGVQALWFAADGWVPNNPRLPVLRYCKSMCTAERDKTAAFETLFSRNGWPPQWRNGIYPFHHYHSNAHEALGIAAGYARVLLGGPHGATVTVTAGDCLLLPAGTGHCLIEASPDLLVIGAYPPGQDCDLRRDALSSAEFAAMSALHIPTSDPVTGSAGALFNLWTAAA